MRYFSTPNLAFYFLLLTLILNACQNDDEQVPPCLATTTTVSLQNKPVDGKQVLWAALADEQGQILEEHFFTSASESIEFSAERDCNASHNLALMYRQQKDSSLQLDYFTRIPPELQPDYSAEQPELLPTTFRITQKYGPGYAYLLIDPRFGNTLEASLDQFNHIVTFQTSMAPDEDFIAVLQKDDAFYRYKGRRDDAATFTLDVPVDSFQRTSFVNCKFEAGVNEVIFAGTQDKSRNAFTPYYSFVEDNLFQLDAIYSAPEPGDFDEFYVKAYGDRFRVEHFADALPEEVADPSLYVIFKNIDFPNHFEMLDPDEVQADLVILQHRQTPGLTYRVFVPTDEPEVEFIPLDSLELQNRFPELNPEFSPATLNYFDWDERFVERYREPADYRQLLELHLSEPPLWRARLGYEARVR